MSATKLKPGELDLRSAHLNGNNYGYIYSPPSSKAPKKRGTIVLIHGFPDISFGWRYQIPFLTELGLEVIAIDCLGYGRSDAPPSSKLSAYTYRRISDDIAELCRQRGLDQIILGGHDWGGAIVYRVQQFYPKLIKAFFSICTPYSAPNGQFTPLDQFTRFVLPNFRYQVHFCSGELEEKIQSSTEIRQWLHAMFGGRTAQREVGFVAEQGVLFDKLAAIQPNKLLDEGEMDYYVKEYARHGINGPLNWYRAGQERFMDDMDFFFDGGKKLPTQKSEGIKITGCEMLFVQATKDSALTDAMCKTMGGKVENLTWKKVETNHWALWERPQEVNSYIGEWLQAKVFDDDDNNGNKQSKL